MSSYPINNPNFVLPISNGRNTARQEMTSNVMEIRPEQADRWLRENVNNRPLSGRTVGRYAADMLAGEWQVSHQGIAFSPTGTLLDGQHRLHAIVKANIPVKMMVSFNVPPNALLVVDQGDRRRLDQQINLAGGMGQVDKIDIAILRAMLAGLMGQEQRKTFSEERLLLARHIDAIRYARSITSGRQIKINSSALAVLARAYYCADLDRLRVFAEALISGMAPPVGGEPVGLLIRWFMGRNGTSANRATRVEIYGRTSRALAAFLSGEKIQKLYMPAHELFALPDDTTGDK